MDSPITAKLLLQSQPTQHSKVCKLRIPGFYSFSPQWLKRLLHFLFAFGGIGRILGVLPSWKERYLILVGKFLYRFENSGQMTSMKGSPLPVSTIEASLLRQSPSTGALLVSDYTSSSYSVRDHTPEEMSSLMLLRDLPPQCSGYFSTTCNSKTTYYATSTSQDAVMWVNTLRERRQEMITTLMGHSKVPYPASWVYVDRLGDSVYKSKNRIKKQMEKYERREMEMTVMDSGGIGGGGMTMGSLPRDGGYFG